MSEEFDGFMLKTDEILLFLVFSLKILKFPHALKMPINKLCFVMMVLKLIDKNFFTDRIECFNEQVIKVYLYQFVFFFSIIFDGIQNTIFSEHCVFYQIRILGDIFVWE